MRKFNFVAFKGLSCFRFLISKRRGVFIITPLFYFMYQFGGWHIGFAFWKYKIGFRYY
jgi:hypothetical protein